MAISSTLLILFNLLCIQTSTVASSKIDSSTTKCIDKERTALIKFKTSLTDETGRLSSWAGQDCCSWKGITCSTKTGHVLHLDLHNPTPFDADKFHHDQDSAYIASYSKTCLSGQLSPALLDLKNLLFLDLSYNNFSTSEIPKFFGEFESLRHLNLSVARFQGTVPVQIGNISGLQFLDMSDFWYNRLVSNSLKWASRLSSLRHLDLSGVHLREAEDWLDSVSGLPSLIKLNLSNTLFPSIFPLLRPRFTSLVSFDLQWNTIDSELPSWLFNISTLVELRLDGNGFYGPIPEDFVRLPSLSILGLSRNFFNSSLPNALFTLRNLSYLDLSQNLFQETVPNGFVNLCNLRFLDLTQNVFTGSIPDFGVINQSGCLRDLEYLRLAYNGLNGPIPPSMGSLTSLKELDMSNNLLNSSIPSSIGQLSSLVKLDISNNSLSGVVSESHFAKLSKLVELSMFQNNLVFNINSNWTPPFQLQTIKLSSCTLGPLFPSWLRTQQDVVELRMSRTGISDSLPDWFEKLYSRVHYLDMSENNISGKLPKFEEANRPGRRLILNSNGFYGALRPLPSDILLFDISNNMASGSIPAQNGRNLSLEVLILSSNILNGSLPNFICEVETIGILDVANNQFSGRIPDCIGGLHNLAMLDFTNNTLHGEIPKSLSNLQLLSLHLHNNSFHGELPSLENMTYLHVLDVAKNSFTGIIPPWIGEKLQNLAFLSLQSNEFRGEIPSNLCQLPQLQLLNLAGNGVVGTIPPCLGNISAMITGQSSDPYLKYDVDYGASIFEIVNGMERLYTTTMQFLTSIDLSDNSISGEIPENLTQLVGLRHLNLAGNGLAGRIPEEIGEMKELISLDLSRNRISGGIPQGLSDLNFLSYLNLSFNQLSGRIPTGEQLRTLESSSYLGNDGLCGAPLNRRCDGDPPAAATPERDGGNGDGDDGDGDGDGDSWFPWLYAGIGPGFLVGFLIVCGVLHFVKSWRYAFFQCIESFVVGRYY